MNTTISSAEASLHRVTKGYRWFTVIAVPPMLALMAWAARETLQNHSSDEVAAELWATVIALALFGGVSLALIAALIWAFRAYVYVDAECMTVRGAFRKTVIRPGLLDGFRIINGQFHVYLKNRSMAIQIAYFERKWSIEHWIRQRATNIDQQFLDEEADDISRDVDLGFVADEKASRLAFLNKLVNRANYLIYAAIVIGAVNFLFVENLRVQQVSVAVLVLTPLMFNLLALSHRGQIRIDYDEGTQYPQIFTGTFAGGITLMLISLVDRGALLTTDLYQFILLGVLVNGLLWCFIDKKRLSILRQRGRAIMLMTVVAFFVIPAAWVGGSLYQFNKLADVSEPVWYETFVVGKTKTSGKGTSYSIDLAPWSKDMDEPVTVTLRRQEYDLLRSGMPVTVAVRDGALNIPWVADVQPKIHPDQ